MGFIGNLFGSGGGSNFQAQGPSPRQMDLSNHNVALGLGEQMGLIDALRNSGQAGIQNQQDVFGQQQALANLYAQQALGGGPNPAQAQFQQNAQQLAAQQAGMIGSQKGMNPALTARLVAQQGAQAGQGIAGQAATLQAQQQLAAQQALAQQQGMMQNVAQQQIGQRQNAVNAYTNSSLGNSNTMMGSQNNANSSNATIAGANAQAGGATLGGLLNGLGTAPMIFKAHGGEVPNFASGGPVSACAQHFSSGGVIRGESYAQQMKPVPGRASVAGDSGKNDTQPAMLSPGEIIIPRSIAEHPNAAEMAAKFVAAVKAKQGRGIG